jgi:HlyD family secretion protein
MSDFAPMRIGMDMDRPVQRKRDLVSKWRSCAIVLAILAVAVLSWLLTPASGSINVAETEIQTDMVTRTPFLDYLPIRTTVAAAKTTFVGTQQGGKVEKLIVQDGAYVEAGKPMATLSNPQLELDVSSREAAIAGQLGDLSGQDMTLELNRRDRANQADTTRYDLIKARRELALRQELHDKGIISDGAMARVRDEFEFQQQRLAKLEAGKYSEDRMAAFQASRLSESRVRLLGTLQAVRKGLDALTIRAPVTGRLTTFDIQPGQMLKAGDRVGQIDSEGDWKLVADVDEYYLSRIVVGQLASGRVDRDTNLPLIVDKVLPAVANGRFRVELGFRGNPSRGLYRGQTLDARVTLRRTTAALMVSNAGWLESSGGNFAFVLDADGRAARRRVIKIGRRNPEGVEILSGLKVGDQIIITDLSNYAKLSVLNLK